MFTLLAANTSVEILKNQRANALSTQESFSQIRSDLLGSGLYFSVSTVAAIIAGITIGWFAIEAFKAHSRNEFDPLITLRPVFWGLIVVLLIGNPINRGSFLGQFVDSGAYFMDGVSTFILRSISDELGGLNVIDAATLKNQVDILVDSGIEQCASSFAEGDERDSCLIAVLDSAQDMIDPFQTELPIEKKTGKQVGHNWSRKLFQKYQTRIGNELANKHNYTSDNFVSRAVTNASLPRLGPIIVTICWLIGAIFGYLQQLSVIMMALVAPIFLALSLAPIFDDAFKNWFKGFLNLGLLKVIFYTITGLASWGSLNSNVDPFIFPLVTALLSLVFSYQLLSGGGASLVATSGSLFAAAPFVIGGARNLLRGKK